MICKVSHSWDSLVGFLHLVLGRKPTNGPTSHGGHHYADGLSSGQKPFKLLRCLGIVTSLFDLANNDDLSIAED